MNMKFKQLSLGAALIINALCANAYEWSEDSYDVYRGDINGDGIEDILLKAKTSFQNYEIPYSINLSVPVSVNEQKNVILYGQGNGSDQYVMDFNPLPSLVGDDSWNPGSWSSLQATIVIEDVDGDGKNDLYLATDLNGSKYAVITSSGLTELPQLKLPQTESVPGISVIGRGSSLPSVSTSVSVGKLDGYFGVSGQGKANYSVSFDTLPSVASLLPALGMSYGGTNANGPLGVGWHLTGLSVISRCSTSIAREGFVDGVNYDASDRFCLNGEPLIAISGNYGASGSVYRTERDIHAKVVSYSSTSSGPTYFKIWRQGGKIELYGSIESSKLIAGSKGTHTWALNKIQDREGNEIDFSYTSTDGELLIDKISYANSAHEVKYQYESRNDQSQHHSEGIVRTQAKRLARVEIKLNNNVVRLYKIGYSYGVQSGMSRIENIAECYSTSNCFPATEFKWVDGPNSHAYASVDSNNDTTQYTSGRAYLNFTRLLGDIDADGRMDLVTAYRDNNDLGFVAYKSSSSKTELNQSFSQKETGLNASQIEESKQQFLMADVNGDGRSDIIWVGLYNKDFYRVVYLANDTGTGFISQGYQVHSSTDLQLANSLASFMADVNGDNLADLVSYYQTGDNYFGINVYTSALNASGDVVLAKTSEAIDKGFPLAVYDNLSVQPGDVNGDGKTDMVLSVTYADRHYRSVFMAKANGAGFDKRSLEYDDGFSQNFDQFSDFKVTLADINGDNRSDLVSSFLSAGKYTIRVYLATEGGTDFDFKKELNISATEFANNQLRLSDLNNDGRADFVHTYSEGNQFSWKTYLTSNTQNISLTASTSQKTSYSDTSYTQQQYLLGDVTADGKADIIWSYLDATNRISHRLLVAPASYVDHLDTVINGYGESVTIKYGFLADASENFYTKSSGATYPIKDDPGLSYAVKEVSRSNGIGGINTYAYQYEGAKSHLTGRGFLGFSKRLESYAERNRTTAEYYIQEWPKTGMMYAQVAKEGSANLESNFKHWVSTSLEGGKTQYVYLKEKLTTKSDNGNTLVAGLTEYIHDTSYGLVDTITETIGTGATSTFGPDTSYTSVSGQIREVVTDRDYDSNTSNWRLGFLTKETVTTTVPGEATKEIINSFTPYSSNSFLKATETLNVGTNNQITISYSNRDSYGNAQSISTVGKDYTGGSLPARVESYGGFTYGLYPSSYTNAENHTTNYSYNYEVGKVKSSTDDNGNSVSYAYDNIGRLHYSQSIDGSITNNSYSSCSTVSQCAYEIETTHYQGAQQAQKTSRYFDMYDRELRNTYYNFDGSLVKVDTRYDAFGRMARRYIPSTSTPSQYTHYSYDALDRVETENNADGGSVSNTFTVASGIVTVSTSQVVKNATSNKTLNSERKINALGQTISSKDHLNTVTTFDYDALGFQRSVTVNGISPVLTEFDIAGNKIKLTDPDYGSVEFDYDAFGNSRKVKHVSANETVIKTFDKLNRLLSQQDTIGSVQGDLSTWSYDTRPNGIGRIASITASNYSAELYYDSYSRIQNKSETILDTTRNFYYEYDQFSRPKKNYYPGNYFNSFDYTSNGHLDTVKDSSNVVIWQAVAGDKWDNTNEFKLFNSINVSHQFNGVSGLIESQQADYGSGHSLQNLSYTFDTAKNLKEKKTTYYDAAYAPSNLTETFGYDYLNRLKTATTSGLSGGTRTQAYNYDIYGNITYKSGISDVSGYSYGSVAANAGPHAVSSVTLNGVTTSYAYDNKGNMETRGNTALTYGIHDNPITIVSPTASINFNYGPHRERIYQNSIDNGKQTETLYFDGGNYNLVKKQTSFRQKIYIDDYAVHDTLLTSIDSTAPLIQLNDRYQFLLNDHLGSTDTIVSENGEIISANRFDPFGLRRKDNQENADADYLATRDQVNFETTNRGYTGHEQLDSVQLVHMNGRVYDPVIGRFLSTDQYVQFPHFSQSYNRYSYVMNNPLSYTDPSGEFIPLVIWGAVALYKAYDTYDTITSGAADLATSLDNSLSTEERALAATALAANVVGVPKFVRKYSGKLFNKSKTPDNNKVDTGTSSNSTNKNQGDTNTTNNSPACKCCFVGDTLVLTNNGHKNIDQLQLGDLVLAKNELTGEISLKPVVDTFIFDDDRTTWLITSSNDVGDKQELEVTSNHPFWVAQQGWVETQNLDVGMKLTTPSGDLFVIEQVQALDVSPITYNITVDEDHTYFAGYENIWVHNCTCKAQQDFAQGSSHYLDPRTNKLKRFEPGEEIHADHIYPAILIKKLPGMSKLKKLSKKDYNEVMHDIDNTQPLPGRLNQSKGSKAPDSPKGEWKKFKGEEIDSQYASDLEDLQNRTKDRLSLSIKNRLNRLKNEGVK
jgi:RHS repeat-associated protein